MTTATESVRFPSVSGSLEAVAALRFDYRALMSVSYVIGKTGILVSMKVIYRQFMLKSLFVRPSIFYINSYESLKNLLMDMIVLFS